MSYPNLRHAYAQLDQFSRNRYHVPGNVLLSKLEQGESSGRADAKSGAGARGWYQFMPGTRDAVLKLTGGKIDPWRSEKEGRDAAVLHLTGALGNAPGLEGYNPGGGQSYVKYILGQKVGGNVPSYTPHGSPAPASALPAPQASSALAETLARPAASVSQPLAPAFSAKVAQPAGYTPPPGVAPQGQQPDLRQQLSDILKADAPPAYQPSSSVAPPVGDLGSKAGSYGAAPAKGFQGGYPLGKRGQVIGTPFAGTHAKAFNVSGGSDNWQSENAVDIRVPIGTPVYAESDGVLGNTGSLGQGGRFAGLRTNLIGKDNAYYYAHMSKLAPGIKAGAHVKKGQLLGYSGEANGVPHLHFAIQRGDPRKLVQ